MFDLVCMFFHTDFQKDTKPTSFKEETEAQTEQQYVTNIFQMCFDTDYTHMNLMFT